MTAVAGALLGAQRSGRDLERVAMPLPVVDSTCDRDDVVVAKLLERPGGEGGAVAGRAVGNDRPRAVRDSLLDPGLQPPARDVHRSGNVALIPLIALADVQKDRIVRVVEF